MVADFRQRLGDRAQGNKILCLIVNTVSVPVTQAEQKSCDSLCPKAQYLPHVQEFKNKPSVKAL